MEEKKLIARMIVRMVLGIVFCVVFFFGTAGTWKWPEAWVYIVIQFTISAVMSVWLFKHSPELLKDRMTFMKKSAKSWDKVFTLVSLPVFFALIIIPGLDAVRHQWSHVPLAVKIVGFAVIIAALYLIFRVMRENVFLSRVVEIQEERGHTVVTTGPYKYVRHPMYVGAIFMFIALPLALGSVYGLIPGALLGLCLIIRTYLEDKTLHRELPGYEEYARITKNRLLPGIW